MTSTPDFSQFVDTADTNYSNDTSGSDIAPIIYDNVPGGTITGSGPIVNTPGIGPVTTPSGDSGTVGGILNGIANVLGGAGRLAGGINASGTVPLSQYRLGGISPLGGPIAGSSGILLLAALAVGAYFLFKKAP